MKNRRLFWQIVDQIEKLIDQGVYPPGSRIPPERELAENFEVSRPTIREAIIALEVRGRIEVKTGSGIYVLDGKQPQQNHENISAFDLTQARALVEGEAAALAAATISEEELAILAKTLVDMENDQTAEAADKLFHQTISNATHNQAILMCVEKLWTLRQNSPTIKQAYSEICAQHASTNRTQEHRDIYSALVARNASEARTAMHRHFNRLINALFDANEAKLLEEIKRKTSETRGKYSLDHLIQ